MARVIVLTHDRRIDRRILLQIGTLKSLGHDVVTYALACAPGEETPGLNVVRLGGGKVSTGSVILRARYALQRFAPSLLAPLLPVLRPLAWRIMGRDPAKSYLALFEQAVRGAGPADIYIAHDLPLLPVAAALKEKHGGRLVYDNHELYAEQDFTAAEQRMWRALEAKYIGRADAVMAVNASIGDELAKRYGLNHVTTVLNAEWLPETLPPREKLFHRAFDLPPDARVLLYQGGFSSGRNLDVLIGAMALVKTPGLHLVLLGDGPLKSKLEHLTRGRANIHFHASVPQAELLRFSMTADAGAIPYQPNCLNNRLCTPNKLFEFIIAGLPMVATDLPELRRFVAGNNMGVVGDTGDARSLAALIDQLFVPETLAGAAAGVADARMRINWQREQRAFAEVILGVLDRARASA